MKYLKLYLNNVEPLSISDASTSQAGQSNVYKYIPGSTIRGFVISKLAQNKELFEKHKKALFYGDVRFQNAYPVIDNGKNELIPSPKGFYEDKKADGNLQNVVVDGTFSDGMKRAGLGNFCYLDKDTVRYCSIDVSSAMQVKVNDSEQNIYRSSYIVPGCSFYSYIFVKDEESGELCQEIKRLFDDTEIFLGQNRNNGYGKCLCKIEEAGGMQIWNHACKDTENSVYMLLLSDAVMRGQDGEYVGLNLCELEDLLGVKDLKIEHCSTSSVTINGYNSTLGIKTPSIPMYEKGSAFKLSYNGQPDAERIKKLMEQGIGERKEEGFGCVLFLDHNYEKLNKKEKIEETEYLALQPSFGNFSSGNNDQEVLRIIARNYYRKLIEDAAQKKISQNRAKGSSAVGNYLSALLTSKYEADLESKLRSLIEHNQEKEDGTKIHKDFGSDKEIRKIIKDAIDKPTRIGEKLGVENNSVMGFKINELFSEAEFRRFCANYLIDILRDSLKKED